MGSEKFRFTPRIPDEELRKETKKLIKDFKEAGKDLPEDFERRGVAWHIDASAPDSKKLHVTAKTSTNYDSVLLEASEDTDASIKYLGIRSTDYGSATIDPGENTQKALKDTQNLLEQLKGE